MTCWLGQRGQVVSFSRFRSWERAYELRASEKNILMIIWKFSTPAKTKFEYSQDSRVCAGGELTSSGAWVCHFFWLLKRPQISAFSQAAVKDVWNLRESSSVGRFGAYLRPPCRWIPDTLAEGLIQTTRLYRSWEASTSKEIAHSRGADAVLNE